MKLASLKHGRDGRLVIVNRALDRMADATDIVPTLQAALDDWSELEPLLRQRAEALEQGLIPSSPFDPTACAAPMPRAYQWLDASAYVNHVDLVRRARGAVMPDSFWSDPLMYQGGSDSFLAAHETIHFPDEGYGIDFEAEVAVIIGDVPMAPARADAASAIRLLVLVNDVSLRHLIPTEIGKGFGFLQSKPSSALSAIAVTPDELGNAWDGGRLHLPLLSSVNDIPFGRPNAGIDMTFDFPTLIMHAARTRRLAAGTIIGSGTVSNRGHDDGVGRPISEGGDGYSCIAEQRVVETILSGEPRTPFLGIGDRITIEMRDRDGKSVFGCIRQTVVVG